MMASDGNALAAIREKVEAGVRLSFEDGLALEASNDLFAIGSMANLVRERYNGNFGYYNVNTHINPTNVCVYKCDFCAFRADLDDKRAYVMDKHPDPRAGEVGPRARGDRAAHRRRPAPQAAVRLLRRPDPLDQGRLSRDPHQGVYRRRDRVLRQDRQALDPPGPGATEVEAGLGSLPGGGAEIFHPEVREEVCGAKASTETWLEVHRTAHKLGLHSNATMLYGHIDKAKHRIDHLVRLRELQDETGGFQTFIPLAFHPDNSRMDEIPKPSGVMDLKTMAISRLMLDNFPHIKAYWVMLGIKTAQVALAFGADDLDGTIVHETIYHSAGADTPQEITVNEIRRLITEAGRIPVERDTLYHKVERDGSRWSSGEAIKVAALAG